MNKAGLVISIEKCALVSAQEGNWLGFIIDLANGCFYVSPEKIDRLQSRIRSFDLDWSDRLRLPEDAKLELVFWKECIYPCLMGKPFGLSQGPLAWPTQMLAHLVMVAMLLDLVLAFHMGTAIMVS